ncbi:MAG: D-glycero-alpha-D-manno-heptose-1,7-bisphosphate 7-phosphatase [Acidimicrobiales bacterium]
MFDRDGTLIVDHPYDPDPGHVELVTGAREAVAALRAAGMRVAVVSNQSGIGRGLLTVEAVKEVNKRADELLGGLDAWEFCPHVPADGCECRKPRAALVRRAAERLGVSPSRCALIGDTGADVEAALAAGAWPVLVPSAQTRPEEVERAPLVASDLLGAAGFVIGGPPKP